MCTSEGSSVFHWTSASVRTKLSYVTLFLLKRWTCKLSPNLIQTTCIDYPKCLATIELLSVYSKGVSWLLIVGLEHKSDRNNHYLSCKSWIRYLFDRALYLQPQVPFLLTSFQRKEHMSMISCLSVSVRFTSRNLANFSNSLTPFWNRQQYSKLSL